MSTCKMAVLGCAGAVAVGAAHGQSNPTFLIEASNPVTPSSPTTVLSVYAAWDQPAPGDYVFSGTDLDFVAADGRFMGMRFILPGSAGRVRDNRVDGLSIGQVHLPQPPFKIFGNPDNPIHLYNIEWTTTDFTRRTVPLHTENTNRFLVTPAAGGPTIDLMATFTPGSGGIVVTPAPGTAVLLGLGRWRRGGGAAHNGRVATNKDLSVDVSSRR